MYKCIKFNNVLKKVRIIYKYIISILKIGSRDVQNGKKNKKIKIYTTQLLLLQLLKRNEHAGDLLNTLKPNNRNNKGNYLHELYRSSLENL